MSDPFYVNVFENDGALSVSKPGTIPPFSPRPPTKMEETSPSKPYWSVYFEAKRDDANGRVNALRVNVHSLNKSQARSVAKALRAAADRLDAKADVHRPGRGKIDQAIDLKAVLKSVPPAK